LVRLNEHYYKIYGIDSYLLVHIGQDRDRGQGRKCSWKGRSIVGTGINSPSEVREPWKIGSEHNSALIK